MAKWIEGARLTWPDIWTHLKMKNKGGSGKGYWKWATTADTPLEVREFLMDFGYGYDCPMRGWVEGLNPGQVAVVLLNYGFAKHLCAVLPDLAVTIGVGE